MVKLMNTMVQHFSARCKEAQTLQNRGGDSVGYQTYFERTESVDNKFFQEFHDVILKNGSVTMDILEDIVYAWVDSK